MDPIAIGALNEIVTTIVVSFTILIGLGLGLRAWTKRAAALRAGDAARLLEGVETMQRTLEDMRQDVADMNDRLDFTERLLTQVVDQSGRRLPGGE